MRLPLVLAATLAACASSPTRDTTNDLALPGGVIAAAFVHPDYDSAQPASTCKPWLRVFALDGRQLTKDLGGTYPHHRGVFIGWNQVRCGKQSFDFWHCHGGESQRVVQLAGGGDAPLAATIDWCAKDGTPIVREARTVAVRRLDDKAFVIDLSIELRAAGADVQLTGDPQHAGCHFRALATFGEAQQAGLTFVRPGDAHPRGDDLWTQCSWIAARLPLAGGDVVVERVEHPDNPLATWSTRAYGRFGAMCTATVTAAAPLHLRYAYIVANDRGQFATFGNSVTTPYESYAARAFAR